MRAFRKSYIAIVCFIALTLVSMSWAEEAQTSADSGKWANESQAAVVNTSGNSETESYSLKHSSEFKKNKDTGKIAGSYLETSAENATTGQSEETAKKWDASLRYERSISEKWSGYVGYLLESDKFAGYRQKHNSDIGGKYLFTKTEKYNVIGEAGYRYVHQNNIDNSQNHYNAGRAYLEGNYILNPTNSAKLWVEYIPNFDDSDDFNTNAELSLSSTLSTLFSLKVAYLVKTDNQTPLGIEKTDTTLTTALVAKF